MSSIGRIADAYDKTLCDHCGIYPAIADQKTKLGPWANLCANCSATIGTGPKRPVAR